MGLPQRVRIVEVGPRDGLQNEKTLVPTDVKVELIDRLSETGLSHIEATSFVSPKWVPQMADSSEVFSRIRKRPGVAYTSLVPNRKGLEQALEAGCREVAVFTAASEAFARKNTNCSIADNFARFREIFELAKQRQVRVRGYLSCVMGCPYDGDVDPHFVDRLARQLLELGCYEVSLGDTIGTGTPEKTRLLCEAITVPRERLAAHFHDTQGSAVENILVALAHGIAVVDSSVGGLGGCPYAKKVAGNVCTENVVHVLHELGVETGVDLARLAEIGRFITAKVGKENLCSI